ncbi:hypothetical protein CJF42_20495 [Pseudoalteromonas sp. NBT06-2]|uniref:acylphosphatase n=1 Tax=Pseudoalteromonas sp. NBT06-2 TaxID=2025950 RepID=UPI000BA4F41F|nr:acylphosphatase [Pseudoalteromonas sp. NBT06-2]PAJ72576.1 hypothetical protein CJF42_20495 [Pseudoalteromonas sp. NBT06-2]
MNKTIKAVVSGKVQGVWFRASTMEVAEKLNLNGYAKNLPNGNVEVMATGEKIDIEKLVVFLSHGPKSSIVDEFQWQWVDIEIFSKFEIL